MVGKKCNLKCLGISSVLLIVILTVILCVGQPKMHKPLQFNIIQYFLKINSDGTTSTTKQTTTTLIREK